RGDARVIELGARLARSHRGAPRYVVDVGVDERTVLELAVRPRVPERGALDRERDAAGAGLARCGRRWRLEGLLDAQLARWGGGEDDVDVVDGQLAHAEGDVAGSEESRLRRIEERRANGDPVGEQHLPTVGIQHAQPRARDATEPDRPDVLDARATSKA